MLFQSTKPFKLCFTLGAGINHSWIILTSPPIFLVAPCYFIHISYIRFYFRLSSSISIFLFHSVFMEIFNIIQFFYRDMTYLTFGFDISWIISILFIYSNFRSMPSIADASCAAPKSSSLISWRPSIMFKISSVALIVTGAVTVVIVSSWFWSRNKFNKVLLNKLNTILLAKTSPPSSVIICRSFLECFPSMKTFIWFVVCWFQ